MRVQAEQVVARQRRAIPQAGVAGAHDDDVRVDLAREELGRGQWPSFASPYRPRVLIGDARRLGIYGFGAAAHIITQVACYQGRRVFAFIRKSDVEGQQFARDMGAVWAGASDELPPEELDAAIIFAPVGALVPAALRVVAKGGAVVCAGIHMSDIPSFPYRLLWGERTVRSVANLTRRDGPEFLKLAPLVPVRTEVQSFRLSQANEALDSLRAGRIRGVAVLVPEPIAK
jgi:alcohol dehydrogenase, propanol-preferring